MGRYAKEGSGGDFTPAPEGTHIARCIKIIDIGTQRGEWKGKPTVRNQVIVMWELPGETFEAEEGKQKPYVVSRFYTNDLYEKANLYKDLVAWRGRPFTEEEKKRFDLESILDKPCLVTVSHSEDGKNAKVTAVAKMVKGMDCPPRFNDLETFWIDEWDDNKFAKLSDGIKGLIEKSDEYKAAFTPPPASRDGPRPPPPGVKNVDDFDDDIPF